MGHAVDRRETDLPAATLPAAADAPGIGVAMLSVITVLTERVQ
jgi:hypothetical protein